MLSFKKVNKAIANKAVAFNYCSILLTQDFGDLIVHLI